MWKFIVVVLISLPITACGEKPQEPTSPDKTSALPPAITSVVVDILKIAGRSVDGVAVVLGEASSCESVKQGLKCFYQSGNTEVVFINDKADWITVHGLDDAPYSEDALQWLGLKKSPASFANDFVMRWSGIQGLFEVSVFPVQDGVDYAYIKASTP